MTQNTTDKAPKIRGRVHDESAVLLSLRKKSDIKVTGTLVQVLKKEVWSDKLNDMTPNPSWRGDVGNGTWGKIDYLVNHCGYSRIMVGRFSF